MGSTTGHHALRNKRNTSSVYLPEITGLSAFLPHFVLGLLDVAQGKSGNGDTLNMRDIDADALKVVRKLLAAGHEAYLVGGCVRDLYVGLKPKDFDVATSARPEQIRRVFRNSRIIGRRFKLAHVFFGTKVIETATFRAPPPTLADGEELLITQDNEWGSVEDDARRRDFTINGLFFDVESRDIVDFVDGMDDLDHGIIRTIGDPWVRFREDPVRMIRAIKFAARLNFTFDDDCWKALLEVASDIAKCPRARLLEEVYKLLRGGTSRRCFELMHESHLLENIWPGYLELFSGDGGLRLPQTNETGASANPDPDGQQDSSDRFWRYLDALDHFVSETRQTPSNSIMQAALFAPHLEAQVLSAPRSSLEGIIEDLMTPACVELGVARRDRELARQIFMVHRRMVQSGHRRKPTLIHRQDFHDALVFLGFSVAARNQDSCALKHWQNIAQLQTGVDDDGSEGEAQDGKRPRRRRGRRGRRGPATSSSSSSSRRGSGGGRRASSPSGG